VPLSLHESEGNATWLMVIAMAADLVRWFQLLCLHAAWREARPGPRRFDGGDVLFDMRVGPHGHVELSRIAGPVGVEGPVAEVEGGKRPRLGTRTQRFAAYDEPGAFGDPGIVAQ
jgi:hypothetical protein